MQYAIETIRRALIGTARQQVRGVAGNELVSKKEQENLSPELQKSAKIARAAKSNGARLTVNDVVDQYAAYVTGVLKAVNTKGPKWLSARETRAIRNQNLQQKVWDLRASMSGGSEPKLSDLRNLFANPNGSIEFPPTAAEWGANEQTPSFRLVRHRQGQNHAAVFEAKRAAIMNEWENDYDYGTYDAGAAPDSMWTDATVEATRRMSFDNARTYLQAIVPDAQSAELDRILAHPSFRNADISFFQCYDTGAEIIGDDLMVITPRGSSDSLVMHIGYVHA